MTNVEQAKFQLKTMLQLQNDLNENHHPGWYRRRFDWRTGIMVNAARAVDELDWKWWKKTTVDTNRLKLILVDLWGFVMSEAMVSRGGVSSAFHLVSDHLSHAGELPKSYCGSAIQHLQRMVLSGDYDCHIGHFARLLRVLDMPLEELYKLYIAKLALTQFREDVLLNHGHYHTDWFGGSDEARLFHHIDSTDCNIAPTDYQNHIYFCLNTDYLAVKERHQPVKEVA